MIPVVKAYHRNPVYLKNMYNDEFCGGRAESHHQKVNVIENENDFQLDLIAPGYKKEEIKVTIDENELTISSIEEKESSKTKDSDDKQKPKYLRKEFSKRSFSRTFKLPENVEAEKIEASHKNGILSIKLPKRVKVEIPVKEIEVK